MKRAALATVVAVLALGACTPGSSDASASADDAQVSDTSVGQIVEPSPTEEVSAEDVDADDSSGSSTGDFDIADADLRCDSVDDWEVTAQVTNTGDAGTYTLTATADGADMEAVEYFDAGETRDVTFIGFDDCDAGDDDHEIAFDSEFIVADDTTTDDDAPLDEDAAQLALQITWDDLDREERRNICFLYDTDPDLAWDVFETGAGEGTFNQEQFDEFFADAC